MPDLALDAATWKELERLLDEALDLPPEARGRWLEALPTGSRRHRERLRALLAHAQGSDARLLALPVLELVPDEAGAEEEPAPATGPGAGDRFGPYQLVRLLAEGGMGAVWLAERCDGLIRRPVALKLLRASRADAGLSERMARERAILATLDHPHIAHLHDAGVTPDGQPWLALEYVEGRALDAFAREERLGLRARLALFLQIAGAVAHAHARMVVHRDLKPSNILVDGEGRARLLDFGIAKLLEEGRAAETELTRVGGRALTPAYASPEQIRGEPIGVASDVYSLGVVLYELLTGARPYRLPRASGAALEEAILGAEPVRPGAAAADPVARRALRGDLGTVVLRALAKRPEERYRTIDAFAEDVAHWLAGRPVQAQPDRHAYRARKFAARHRLAVSAVAAGLVALSATAGVALWQASRARAEQRSAVEVKDFIASIFRDADPYVAGRAPSATDLLKQARAKVDRDLVGRPQVRVELLTILGVSLHRLQDLESAEAALQEAVATGRRELGPDAPATLKARSRLIPTRRLLGHSAGLLPEMEALLARMRPHPERYADELVEALWQASSLTRATGREAESVPLAEEALAVALERRGAHHPLTAESTTWLASAEIADRRPTALLTATQAVERTLEVAGGDPRHPNAIQARLVHARALEQAHQGVAALAELEEVLRDARAVFGPESTVVAYALPHLAQAQLQAGRLREALASAQESARAGARKVRPGSPGAAHRAYLLGRVLLAARRPEEALPGLEAGELSFRALAGPAHHTTVAAARRRALALALLGRMDEARAVLTPEVGGEGAGAALGDALPVPGTVRRLAGDPAGARLLHQAAFATLPPGPDADLARMRLLAELGQDDLLLGRAAQAEGELAEAASLFRRLQAEATPERAEALVALGRARLALGRRPEALAALREADGFWRDFAPGSRGAVEAARALRQVPAAARRARQVPLARAEPPPTGR